MILVLTNADTEILALRTVAEGLPEGFPGVRAANPASWLRALVGVTRPKKSVIRSKSGRITRSANGAWSSMSSTQPGDFWAASATTTGTRPS